MRAAFIYCFTMLQNSSSIDEFNQNLEDMVTIFCQPKLSQLLLRSLVRMNIEISIRNYDWLNQLFKKFDRKFLITSKESGIEDLYLPNDMSKNYFLDSPFTKFFEQRLSFYKKCIKEESKDQIIKTNEFYKPILMKIIEKRINLVPLWSGVLISLDKDNFPQRSRITRLTNNPVESWFGYFRNNILDINKRLKFKRLLFPSEIVIPYYSYLSMKFKQFYEKDCIDFSKIKDGHNNSEEEEKWEFKKEKKLTKEKGIYFTNKFTFGIDNFKQEDSLKTQFRGKSELFSIPLIDVENSEFKAEVSICFREHIFFYSNYSKMTCKNVFELLNNDLLSDEIIFNYFQTKGQTYNIRIIDYFSTSKIFNGMFLSENIFDEDLNSYSMIAGLVYDPLCHHWCLFFVDVKNQSFSFLDSLGAENDNIYFEKF
ncbi:hypothetical protein BpHYR1_041414 [Brachionus plicatilis]|uniref:Ubiquitin-like protease family profile domain-containing protein n=1 Tax=Brachionus plicatilis TaxID=10195 RepID=A0A3M7PUV0_BRAPC|nr:hypothetical protein BpHYR1_041414 [Brachionus plicatilis]